MKVTPLNGISQLEDGELVMRVEGEITRVFDRKSGTKGDKDWSIQNLMLRDDSGEIRVGAWNHEDLSSFAGKKVSITAHKSDKGFSGVYCELNDYKGKVSKQLRLTYTAKIERLYAQSKPADADSSSTQSSSARPNSSAGSRQREEHQNDSSATLEASLAQICNAQYLIFEAEKNKWENMALNGLVPEFTSLVGNAHFQADCSIAWGKINGQGLVESLSTKPTWKETKTSRFVKSPVTQPTPDDDEIPF